MNIRRNSFALVALVAVGMFQQSAAPMRNNNNNNNNAIVPRGNNSLVAQKSNFMDNVNAAFNDPKIKQLVSSAYLTIKNNDRKIKKELQNYLGEDFSQEFIDQAYNAACNIFNPGYSPARKIETLFHVLSLAHGFQVLQAAELASAVPTLLGLCGIELSELTKDILDKVEKKNECSLGLFFMASGSLMKDSGYYLTGMDEDSVDLFLSACTQGKYRLTQGTKQFIAQLESAKDFEEYLNTNAVALLEYSE